MLCRFYAYRDVILGELQQYQVLQCLFLVTAVKQRCTKHNNDKDIDKDKNKGIVTGCKWVDCNGAQHCT